jgi:hypothetical protein
LDSALAGFEAPMRLIDDVDAALAAHDPVVPVAAAERFQRIADFHGTISYSMIPKSGCRFSAKIMLN